MNIHVDTNMQMTGTMASHKVDTSQTIENHHIHTTVGRCSSNRLALQVSSQMAVCVLQTGYKGWHVEGKHAQHLTFVAAPLQI